MATNGTKKRPRRQIPNLCRICLTGSSSMSDLAEFLDGDEDIVILKALETVMCCNVVISSKIPSHICSMCLSLLRISYNLKNQFEETQRKLLNEFGEITQTALDVLSSDQDESNQARSEVDIIVGKDNYSLDDILIVEDEDEISYDYNNFLENLGKGITVEYLKKQAVSQTAQSTTLRTKPAKLLSNEQNPINSLETYVDDNTDDSAETGEYETIVIQSVSDDEENASFHWEHEYAKNTSDNIFKIPTSNKREKKGGRRSKYPQSLVNKINSLIIEGDIDTSNISKKTSLNDVENTVIDNQSEDPNEESIDYSRRRKRGTNIELQEIEKYIIFGDKNEQGEKNLNIHKDGTTDMPAILNESIDNMVQLDVFNLESDENVKASVEIDSAIMTDDLFLDALNTKHICKLCSMACATKTGLKRHLFFVHNEKDVTLRLPRKRDKMSRAEKIRHKIDILRQKFKKNPLLCQICGHVSRSTGGASYHARTHGEKMHTCDLCPRKFYTPSHLKHHREYKHEKKCSKHLCPLCGEYRNSSTALTYHMKLHTNEEKKFPCSICGLKFIVKSALNNHLRRHNGDRRFPCDICDKSFFSTNELKKHVMTHTGERPHQCKYCEKRFVTTFNKKVHMMTHDGPYRCEYCHKGFIDVDMLNMHLKHKHRISKAALSPQSDQEGYTNETQLLEGLNLLPPEDDNLDFDGD